jgi:hypothetical protein
MCANADFYAICAVSHQLLVWTESPRGYYIHPLVFRILPQMP